MTQEQKDLLLKDLCARLPYGVKIQVDSNCWGDFSKNVPYKITLDNSYRILLGATLGYVKPYLFPLSSMTNEMWEKEFWGCGITEFTRDSFKYGCETLEFNNSNPNLSSAVRFINQLIKNHFDIYGLIPMGLAIDATGLNIY